MEKHFCKTELEKTNHTTFGGIIYPSDFNIEFWEKGDAKSSAIAGRIVSDWKFDKQCMQNIKNRKNKI